jgi:hypothetical protein
LLMGNFCKYIFIKPKHGTNIIKSNSMFLVYYSPPNYAHPVQFAARLLIIFIEIMRK